MWLKDYLPDPPQVFKTVRSDKCLFALEEVFRRMAQGTRILKAEPCIAEGVGKPLPALQQSQIRSEPSPPGSQPQHPSHSPYSRLPGLPETRLQHFQEVG